MPGHRQRDPDGERPGHSERTQRNASPSPHRHGASRWWPSPPRPARRPRPRAGPSPRPPRPAARRRLGTGGRRRPAAGTPGTAEAAAASTIEVEAFDLGFTPAAVSVPAAGTYKVTFANTGSTLHDMTFADGTKLSAEAGKTVQGEVAIPAGGLSFICSIPGHEQAGMAGQVTVGDGRWPAWASSPPRRPPRRHHGLGPGRGPERAAVRAARPDGPGAGDGHRPRHRLPDHREGHHRRRRASSSTPGRSAAPSPARRSG